MWQMIRTLVLAGTAIVLAWVAIAMSTTETTETTRASAVPERVTTTALSTTSTTVHMRTEKRETAKALAASDAVSIFPTTSVASTIPPTPTTAATASVAPTTTQPPEPTSTTLPHGPTSSTGGSDQDPEYVKAVLREVFGAQGDKAIQVAQCESKLNQEPGNPSPTNDWGVLQINEPTWNHPGHSDPVADWIGRHWHNVTDVRTNAQMAYRIWEKYGWGMWSCA